MSLLALHSIAKRFSGTVALDDVSLSLHPGKILALVGENGAGKSTLMKVLSGVHQPDSGTIELDAKPIQLSSPQHARDLGINIIYQEFSLVPYLSVLENLFLGRERVNSLGICCNAEMRSTAKSVFERLGADIALDATVHRLGIAQQQYVEIAKALLGSSRILIMDEPTATLTASEASRLLDLMRELASQGIAIIFISHHLDEVFAIADEIICLRDGKIVGKGPKEQWNHDELIRSMVGRDISNEFSKHHVASDSLNASRPVVLEVRCLQRKAHLPSNAFELRAGEILGVAGLVGSGRTKMIRALVGADRACAHDVHMNGRPVRIRSMFDAKRAGIGLVPEDRKREGLVLSASVKDNLVLAALYKLCHPLLRTLKHFRLSQVATEKVEQLSIKASSLQQRTATLSGGNQQKVVLGKWLLTDCKVLILDEPTRGVDIGARSEIYRLLRDLCQQGLAILLVSSEVPEILGMSDRILVMRNQRIVHQIASAPVATEEEIMRYAAGGAHV